MFLISNSVTFLINNQHFIFVIYVIIYGWED